ncbi:MAG TPA: hypothetical protein VFK69_09810 [Candidatus Eisenbacteria bacterium]|nr:hypothetical protein [Candidatus Eisenbacteria bacterium]
MPVIEHHYTRWVAPLLSVAWLVALPVTALPAPQTDRATATVETAAPSAPASPAPAAAETSASATSAAAPTADAATTPTAAAPATTAPVATGGASAPAPGAEHLDLPAWLDYKARAHLTALPVEARLFYRRGVMLRNSGSIEEGLRDVRGAAELDPAYLAPHLTMAEWFLFKDPSQALLHYAAVLSATRDNVAMQLALAGNALVFGFGALFLALVLTALMVLALHQRELRHPWFEWLSRRVSPRTATVWSWAFLLLPFAAGFGLALPAVLLLGWLWPSLRARERGLLVCLVALLVAVPWAGRWVDRMAAPLREDAGPTYGVLLDENAPWNAERARTLDALAARESGNGFVQFARGWLARRHGDLAAAEDGFRHALKVWPDDPSVLTDLGNVLALENRDDEALAMYQRAVSADRGSAAGWYDLAQLETRHFVYRDASDALTRATALDFEGVKNAQSESAPDGSAMLMDRWIAPARLWNTVWNTPLPAGRVAWPEGWRGRVECAGQRSGVLALVLALIGIALGVWGHHHMPLRRCSNCDTVVCRRCASRRRETALCPGCAAVEARSEVRDFGHALLAQHRRRQRQLAHMARTTFAALLPGFGLVAFRRVVTPVLLLFVTALLAAQSLGVDPPFASEPRLGLPEHELPLAVLVGGWVALYALSMFGYLLEVARAEAREAEQDAPTRGRTTQATRRTDARAA